MGQIKLKAGIGAPSNRRRPPAHCGIGRTQPEKTEGGKTPQCGFPFPHPFPVSPPISRLHRYPYARILSSEPTGQADRADRPRGIVPLQGIGPLQGLGPLQGIGPLLGGRCSEPTGQPYSHTAIQPYSHTAIQPYNHTNIQTNGPRGIQQAMQTVPTGHGHRSVAGETLLGGRCSEPTGQPYSHANKRTTRDPTRCTR